MPEKRVAKVRRLLCDSIAVGFRAQLLCHSLLELCDVDSHRWCNTEEDGNGKSPNVESSDTSDLTKPVKTSE